MNGATIGAPAPAAMASAASTAGPVASAGAAAARDDAGTGLDFAALLDHGADVAVTSDNAAPKTGAEPPDAGDDAKADRAAPAPADSALPDWLQALRESVALVGAIFAPTPTPALKSAKLAAAPPTPSSGAPTVTPAGTGASTALAGAKADASTIALVTADAASDSALCADTATPTADRRFDALLAAAGDHDLLSPAATGLASGALAAMPVTTTSTAGAAAPPMSVPPDHPQFAHELGERIIWISDAGLSSAKIELHPLDLGSVHVHVQMRGDTAQIAFAADNPATRALLQDSLPQLRELMSVQGLQLLRAQVEQKLGATRASDTCNSPSRGRDGDGDGDEGRMPVRRVTRLKLVDAYV